MKRHLLSILILAFCLPLFAAEPEKAATPPPVAPPAAKASYSDAFLGFALEKAKLYSGTIEETIGKGVDLAAKELPETMRQFLVWRAWSHGIKAFVPPIFLALFIALQLWQWPRFEFYYRERLVKGTELNVIASIVAWVGIVASGITSITVSAPNLMALVQLWVAPRIYVIEQVISFAKR